MDHKVRIQLNFTNGNHAFNLSLFFAPVRLFAFSSLGFLTAFSITSLFSRNNKAVHKCSSNSAQCFSAKTSLGIVRILSMGEILMVLLSLQKWNWLITHMLDGDGESVLKALEEANPQTIEPRKNDMADIILACAGALKGW